MLFAGHLISNFVIPVARSRNMREVVGSIPAGPPSDFSVG